MSHELSNLISIPRSTRAKRRVGRGIGSGNGKTCGRGQKGQKSRSGGGVRPGFEGGQMPMQRRLPKRGFVNIFAKTVDIVNLDVLERIATDGSIDIQVMVQAGVVSGNHPIKILAKGTLSKALEVKANAFSVQAEKKIKACGGSVEVV